MQQSFSKENEENAKKFMIQKFVEKKGLKEGHVKKTFNSIYLSAVFADIGE